MGHYVAFHLSLSVSFCFVTVTIHALGHIPPSSNQNSKPSEWNEHKGRVRPGYRPVPLRPDVTSQWTEASPAQLHVDVDCRHRNTRLSTAKILFPISVWKLEVFLEDKILAFGNCFHSNFPKNPCKPPYPFFLHKSSHGRDRLEPPSGPGSHMTQWRLFWWAAAAFWACASCTDFCFDSVTC